MLVRMSLFIILILSFGCNKLTLNAPNSNSVSSPQALTVTVLGETAIKLDWEDPQDETPTGYKIAYAARATPPMDCESDTVISDSEITGTSHIIRGLTGNTHYSFSVCAVGETPSFVSNTSDITVETTLAAAPPNPSALNANVDSTSQITLNWTSGDETTVDFRISYQTGATAPANCDSIQINEDSISGLSHAISGLSPNTQYSFRICAINGNTIPDKSSGMTVTATTSPLLTQAAPNNPSNFTAPTQNEITINLNWDSGGGSTTDFKISYQVGGTAPATCSSGTLINEGSVSGTSHLVTGLIAGTQYSFRVCSINANSTPDISSGITVTASTLQSAPTNPSAFSSPSQTITSINLSWTTGGGSTTDFRISYQTGATAPTTCAMGTTISESSVTGTSHSVAGLIQSTQYSFRVCAINGNSTPDVSSGVTTTVSTSTPAGPAPFVSIWRTTTNNESITLPLRSFYTHNFTVDWGDETAVGTVTAHDDADRIHSYAAPGDYTITIVGTLNGLDFMTHSTSRLKLIEVVDLGEVGWTRLDGAFYNCTNLTSFAGGVTTNVTNMNFMFQYTSSLVSADFSSFDTTNVQQMSSMFEGASALTSIDLSNFNTPNLTNTAWMFANTSSATSINLSSFDTSGVTAMYDMFIGSGVTSLNLSNFDTSSVGNISWMFALMPNLTSLNVTGWDLSGVTDANNIFNTTNAGVVVTCDQGGSPGTGSFYGKSCN